MILYNTLFCLLSRTVNKTCILGWICALLLFSCGYQFSPSTYEGEKISISIPYIQGDPSALFNNALASSLAQSGRFHCLQSGGDFTVEVVLLSDTNDRIGYRYDRDDVTGSRKPNVLGIENRRYIIAQVTVYDAHSAGIVLGPLPIKAFVDYDYVDYGSPRDLNTHTSNGMIPTIQYSYGQLNTVEGAHDDASVLIYQKLSDRIVDVISYQIFK